MDHYWGNNSGLINHPLLKMSDKSMVRISYLSSPDRQTITNREFSWNYPHGSYGMMSYQKAGIILHTLMGLIGEDAMNEVFKEYYRRWAFKHPSGRDFIAVFNDVVPKIHGDKFGPDMNWFFDQTLYGTGIADYAVNSFSNVKIRDFKGIVSEADSMRFVTNVTKDDSVYTSTVMLNRVHEIKRGGYEVRAAQKSSKRPERMQQRRARMALAPRTDQCMPDCLRRSPTTVRQPASMTPEPTKQFLALKSA